MDLVDFVRARLDEDEQEAIAASPGPWHANAEQDEVVAVDGETVADGFALSSEQLRATVRHIVRYDPARVLREVEAKREIIELHTAEPNQQSDECPHDLQELPCPTLRCLALPYADHPDYREEWRP